MRVLYVGFRGKGNSSNKIVNSLSGDKLFLMNSHAGLKNDIDRISEAYDLVYMFGLDKSLKGNIRIDRVAEKDHVRRSSDVDPDMIADRLSAAGISASIGVTPTKYLCNEAFWHMLGKYDNHVVFFHVPSIRYINEVFIEKIKKALCIGADNGNSNH